MLHGGNDRRRFGSQLAETVEQLSEACGYFRVYPNDRLQSFADFSNDRAAGLLVDINAASHNGTSVPAKTPDVQGLVHSLSRGRGRRLWLSVPAPAWNSGSYELTLAIPDLRHPRADGRQSHQHNAAPPINVQKELENPDCRTLAEKFFRRRAAAFRYHPNESTERTRSRGSALRAGRSFAATTEVPVEIG